LATVADEGFPKLRELRPVIGGIAFLSNFEYAVGIPPFLYLLLVQNLEGIFMVI
jgi:hypothetical protein